MVIYLGNHFNFNKRGLTLPELLISVSIIMIIFAFSGINLLTLIPKSDLNQIGASFIADAKSQQISAMLGESHTSSQLPYGIKIDSNSYTLFRGQVYNPSDPYNYTVNYPQNVSAQTTFPNAVIIFSPIRGEIVNFQSGFNRVIFTAPYGKSYTILFNKLGNVYYVNVL